jgi:hypothetical protein
LTYDRQAGLFVGFSHVQAFHEQVDRGPEFSDVVGLKSIRQSAYAYLDLGG